MPFPSLFAAQHDIDMVAASFVRSAEGVHEIRDYLRVCLEEAAQSDPTRADEPLPLIISKIESTEALEELSEIIAASDGIMVARGDLGVEVPIEHIATYQKDIVEMCVAAGKPVVVATQMLESMQKNPRPTRAEVADVTNAVLDGADAVMLSGESANGKYPSESISMQASICKHAENWSAMRGLKPWYGDADALSHLVDDGMEDGMGGLDYDFDHADGLGSAAVVLAKKVNASAILVFDHIDTARLARAVCKHRPPMPIAAISDSIKMCRQLNLSKGIEPLLIDSAMLDDFEEDIALSYELTSAVMERTELLGPDDTAVCVFGNQISVETMGDHFFSEEEEE